MVLEAKTTVDSTRFPTIQGPLKIVFLVLSMGGVALSIYFLFGFTYRGSVMVEVSYYYLMFAFFIPCVYLILPARRKTQRVPWYDMVAAAAGAGIPIYF